MTDFPANDRAVAALSNYLIGLRPLAPPAAGKPEIPVGATNSQFRRHLLEIDFPKVTIGKKTFANRLNLHQIGSSPYAKRDACN